VRTFLDSGVVMTAWKIANQREAELALAVIDDDSRQPLTSEMVRLELLPKAIFFKRAEEVSFYEEIFSRCECDRIDDALYASAFDFAKRYGLAAADAFNIASAVRLDAAEFVTTELPGKALFRVKETKVVTVHAAASLE
jgi:predicted nucleic acid-binding protein